MMVGVEFSCAVRTASVEEPADVYSARFDHYPS
jgi:transcription elongation factor Elf1